jgi:pSer/pThr/pTyr-binding forkhead associated (FHA) protein
VWMLRTAEDAKQPFLFRITPGNIKTVGRAPRADFVVDAALVSRLHCRLAAGAGEIEAVDLESTNGTYVNGQRVERALLKEGDRLRVGAVELEVVKTGKAES